MPGYILTGTPGSGKTAILRQLELDGYPVVEEAATDVIALGQALGRPKPWESATFFDEILDLQRRRYRKTDGVTFFDRSPVCTLALSRHLGRTEPASVRDEVERVLADGQYERTAFFVRNLGHVEPTAARRISLADALDFERTHERTYRELGFTLIEVAAGPLPDRVALIERTVERLR
jgi:predicted ATPase